FSMYRVSPCFEFNFEHVAVGTALAGGPPHGSGRAALLHPALALGNNASAGRRVRMITTVTPILHHRLTYPLKRVEHAHPALCLGHVTLGRIPLGQPPSLHRLLSLRLALRLVQQRRHPGVATAGAMVVQFRGSIPGLYVPLSTLHPRPYARRYMTRGQCGSLLLHCMKLSFTTPYRLLPAHLNLEHICA